MNLERAKLVLRIAGVATSAAGVTCFPVGYGINPKRDLSVFNNLADTGMFVTLGVILLVIGAVMLAASSLLRGAQPPDHV